MITEDMGVDVLPREKVQCLSGGLQKELCKGLWQLDREAQN